MIWIVWIVIALPVALIVVLVVVCLILGAAPDRAVFDSCVHGVEPEYCPDCREGFAGSPDGDDAFSVGFNGALDIERTYSTTKDKK